MATLCARALGIGITERELRDASGPLATTPALAAALAHKTGALLLLGPPGTGKTLAATRWLVAPLLELGNWEYENGRWFTPRQYPLVWRTAKSLSRVKQYDTRDLEMLFEARRLGIDDLGQEFLDKSGFLSSLIDEIVTERHRRGRATAMTANLNLEEFEDRYGDRVLDRVRGDGTIVVCDGESLRTASVKPTIPHALGGKDVAARAKACADRQLREAQDRHLAWLESERTRSEQLAAAPPAEPERPMTLAEQEERKAKIARDMAEWTARNGGTTT